MTLRAGAKYDEHAVVIAEHKYCKNGGFKACA